MWDKPSYEVIDVCAEVTAYVYKDEGADRRNKSTKVTMEREHSVPLKSEQTSPEAHVN